MKASYLCTAAAAFSIAGNVYAAEIIDSEKNANTVGTMLNQSCSSYKAQVIEECINTNLSLTLGLSQAFIKYLKDPSAEKVLIANCEKNFNAIVAAMPPALISQDPVGNLPVFVQTGLLGARKCLQTIENIGDENGVDYMPSSRKILNDFIDNAEQGKIIFKFDI